MGYTTEFEGGFTFDRELPTSLITQLMKLEETEFDKDSYPSKYCQWVLADNCTGLKWDGEEKFYAYEEWLQWIIDNILKPAEIKLLGVVSFQGEEIGDSGTLTLDDEQIVKRQTIQEVKDDLAELTRFRDWVLRHDWWRDGMNEEWRKYANRVR